MPVVAERLGHSKVSMTADVYAHVLPKQQQQAAATLGALLRGRNSTVVSGLRD
jgi:integrase